MRTLFLSFSTFILSLSTQSALSLTYLPEDATSCVSVDWTEYNPPSRSYMHRTVTNNCGAEVFVYMTFNNGEKSTSVCKANKKCKSSYSRKRANRMTSVTFCAEYVRSDLGKLRCRR